MSDYTWPPPDADAAELWADEHPHDAIAYAAGWTHSGLGYGAQAHAEWPACPGFDFEDGLPDWDHGLDVDESRFCYRTVLWDSGGFGGPPSEADGGWELLATFAVNPEPELFDDDGVPTGIIYVGEYAVEAVYRRALEEDGDEP